MNKVEIIAYHGWGFDRSVWSGMSALTGENQEWKNFDRGYFNQPKSPEFSGKNQKNVLITHSFGLHLCEKSFFEDADLLVIISGFLTFHPQLAQFRRRSKMVLNEMLSRFSDQPENVLKAFYRNVFHPERSYDLPQSDFNQDLLLKDLRWLDRADRSLADLNKSAKVCIFQGADDAIVPKEKGRALHEQFGEQSKYYEIKNSGHALPVTHAQKCWDLIVPEIERLNK